MWIILIVAGAIVYEKAIAPTLASVKKAADNASKVDPTAVNNLSNAGAGFLNEITDVVKHAASSSSGGNTNQTPWQAGTQQAVTSDIGAAGDVGFGDAAASVSNGVGEFTSSFSNWFNS